MQITSEHVDQAVIERELTLEVDGEQVPGTMWLPEGAEGRRPFVLLGHGGLQSRRAPNIVGLARQLVTNQGYGVVALDAPGHGDRSPDAAAVEATRQNLAAGKGRLDAEQTRQLFGRIARHGDEWRALLDALDAAELSDGQIGYWGVSMGTMIGLPLTASEPRIRAAVFGLAGLRDQDGADAFGQAARQLSVPVLFLFQWDDQLMSRESGLALFDAIGSREKSMHINPGGHVDVPLFERQAAEAFYVRTLGGVPALT